jgi:lipoate-protein ligase A
LNSKDGRIIVTEIGDVQLNLALEQAIFQYSLQYEIPTIRIWTNPKSVILGRVQDIKHEINEEYCKNYRITIGRRITGGGTVYHDLGNLNISFFLPFSILPIERNLISAIELLTNSILQILVNMGYQELEKEGNSNIFWKGKKISGSAGRLRSSWLLHHATLLHSADLSHLENALLARSSEPNVRNGSRYFPTINLDNFRTKEFVNYSRDYVEEEIGLNLLKKQIKKDEIEFATFLKDRIYTSDKWIRDGKMKPYKIDSYS